MRSMQCTYETTPQNKHATERWRKRKRSHGIACVWHSPLHSFHLFFFKFRVCLFPVHRSPIDVGIFISSHTTQKYFLRCLSFVLLGIHYRVHTSNRTTCN